MTAVAVIGLGKMGILHAAMASVVPGARTAALCDRDARLAPYAASIGLRAPFYATVEELLDKEKIDVAVIATPQFAHEEPALACLRRGVAVLCEKPLANTLQAAERMAAAARAAPDVPAATALMIGHYPIYRHVKTLLHEGVLGRLESYQARMLLSQVFAPKQGWIYTKARSGGGVLINSGAHPLYVLHDWFGPPDTIAARCLPVHSREVEDRAELTLTYPGGLRGELLADWSVRGYPSQFHEFVVRGERGVLTARDRDATLTIDGATRLMHEADFPQPRFNLTPHYGGTGYYFQMEDIIACRRGERAHPRVDWSAGLAVSRLIDAAYRSSALGGQPVAVSCAP